MISFMIHRSVAKQYALGDRRTRRRGPHNSFFRWIGVKAIGEMYHSPIAGRSAESAAARGSCGNYEVIKA